MSELYGNFRNRKFSDIWPDALSFVTDYLNAGIDPLIKNKTATTLYYLLYARYGNSTIASFDENQFKYKVFTYIFMYGPTWEKRLEIQKELREMDIEEFIKGSIAINNHSYNPSTTPSTQTLEELTTINEQNVSKYKRGIAEAYTNLIGLLETDVTAYFLDRFKSLFLQVVQPELPLWYVTPIENNGDDNDDE